MRIYDSQGRQSEAIPLQKSTNHKNKFERNQTGERRIRPWISFHSIDARDLFQITSLSMPEKRWKMSLNLICGTKALRMTDGK